MAESIVIVGAKRTPIGAMQGKFNTVTASQLGAVAIKSALEQAGVKGNEVDDLIFGNVLSAGQGQAPARQAALGAGMDKATPTTTINKMCGSAMKAAMMGADEITAGQATIVVAGGMESMTNAPHLLPKGRGGIRYGHGKVLDHMAFDGLENAYDGKPMGHFADKTAEKYGFTREEMDAYSKASTERALAAVKAGAFTDEIAPVTVEGRKGNEVVSQDETPFTVNVEKISTLRPAFNKDGTVTAATSSSISDGAAALVLMTESEAKKRGAKPLAKIIAYASNAHEPEWFTTAPVGAIKKVLDKAGWKAADVDLFEVNEAFAVVAMAAMKDIGIPHDKINVNGGAVALGHPIGATGARIITTLIYALKKRGGKKGVAALCIGGGEGTALALEVL
ncbi:thiolase family protein [Usitatibacter palustris]|uniref:Acetyl-CoA acetyltransferase n=1 Tax=Usitatibacter palustris TaxID=2732487 RepID=A0A6M4H5R7_9PROT|nr:acetyl-CoA C-acyltransferase [Usitatibacter palustris]QJR14966.1 Acetyl-CoA acetyltransferase [Usitatibacter palustris]